MQQRRLKLCLESVYFYTPVFVLQVYLTVRVQIPPENQNDGLWSVYFTGVKALYILQV